MAARGKPIVHKCCRKLWQLASELHKKLNDKNSNKWHNSSQWSTCLFYTVTDEDNTGCIHIHPTFPNFNNFNDVFYFYIYKWVFLAKKNKHSTKKMISVTKQRVNGNNLVMLLSVRYQLDKEARENLSLAIRTTHPSKKVQQCVLKMTKYSILLNK